MAVMPNPLPRAYGALDKDRVTAVFAFGHAALERPGGDPGGAGGVAALARGRGQRLGTQAVLLHKLQQRRKLLVGQRPFADVDHHLRAVEKIRRLAQLIAQRV